MRVLSRRWDVVVNVWVRSELIPLHGADVQVAGGVGAVAEASGHTLLVLVLLATEDEELPGWDGFNESGAVVPPGHADNQVVVGPFSGLEVVEPHVVEVHLRVPASVDVELALVGEETVATASLGQLLRNRLELGPSLLGQVERVDVVERSSRVAHASVAALDEDLAIVDAGSHVGSWGGSTDGGGGILKVVWIIADFLPSHLRRVEDP